MPLRNWQDQDFLPCLAPLVREALQRHLECKGGKETPWRRTSRGLWLEESARQSEESSAREWLFGDDALIVEAVPFLA